MALFVYTSSHWGVESSREGSPDSNIRSYQPASTTDSSVQVAHIHVGKSKRVFLPVTCMPSQEQFGLGWSSEEERAKVEVQEYFDDSEIEGLIRTHA